MQLNPLQPVSFFPAERNFSETQRLFFAQLNEDIDKGADAVVALLKSHIEVLRTYPEWLAIKIDHPDFQGATPLWLAAVNGLWDFVCELGPICPLPSLDVAPLKGEYAGVTILWLAVVARQWDIVRDFMALYPIANLLEVDIGQHPQTFIGIAAKDAQWDIVVAILERFPHANFASSPHGGGYDCPEYCDCVEHRAIGRLALEAPEAIQLYVTLVKGQEFANRNHPAFGQQLRRFTKSVKQKGLLFGRNDNGHYTGNPFVCLPTEIQEQIIFEALQLEWPELQLLPTATLKCAMRGIFDCRE
jgi:hypothetical protein